MGRLEELFREILIEIGEDPEREGLQKTPARAAKALQDFTRGYQQDPMEVLNNAVFSEQHHDMVIVRNVEMYSLCEHHLVPFFGAVSVGYIPDDKIIGLSKIARIVDVYARRLQVQERLTHQIAEAIQTTIQPKGVGVVVKAQHMCMMARGVEKQHSSMVTSCVLGSFRADHRTRQEFMDLVRCDR